MGFSVLGRFPEIFNGFRFMVPSERTDRLRVFVRLGGRSFAEVTSVKDKKERDLKRVLLPLDR